MLVACADEDAPGAESESFEFSIELLSESELAELEGHTEVVYRDVGFDGGLNLLFEFNQPVTDFAFIEIVVLDDGSVAKAGVLHEVGDLEPDESLVLTHYFGHGTLPVSGFHFVDPDGEGRWFTFQQSQMDGEIHWDAFDWNEEYEWFTPEVDLPDLDDVEGMMPEVQPINTIDIRIEWLRETLHDFVEFNYADVRGTSAELMDTLLIAPPATMREFAIVAVDHDGPDLSPQAVDVLFLVGDLTPDTPLLIRDYFAMGCTLPESGFTFIDETGTRRFFTFMEDPYDHGLGFFVREFFQEDFTFWDYEHTQ